MKHGKTNMSTRVYNVFTNEYGKILILNKKSKVFIIKWEDGKWSDHTFLPPNIKRVTK